MSIKTDAVVIRDEITTGANTATRVGTNLVDIADDLVAKQVAIDLNNAKVGITAQQASDITTNNAKVGVTNEEANPDVVEQAEAEAGTSTTERTWTAERVKQAIVALGGSGSVDDTAYDISWNGVTTVAPSKNAIYDFIESQVFKVDSQSDIVPIFWSGTQAEYVTRFGGVDAPPNFFTVVTNAVIDVEGIDVLSTGVTAGFVLQADGDNTSSWVAPSAASTASDVINVPSGNLVAIDVQTALNELQTEIDDLRNLIAPVPIASFTNLPSLSINETESITFADTSTNTPTSWSWSFEGGSPLSSITESQVVSYASAGTYDVSLIATNANGSSAQLTKQVTVAAAPVSAIPQIASFFTTSENTSDADLVLTAPTGIQVGDLLLVLVGTDANTEGDAAYDNATKKPTGFTLINSIGNGANQGATGGSFYKIAEVGDIDASVTVPRPTAEADVQYAGSYMRITGANTTTPIGVQGTNLNTLNNPIEIPSITTINDNSLVIAYAAINGSDTQPYTISGTGWSKKTSWDDITGPLVGAGEVGGVIATKEMATAGDSLICTATMDGASDKSTSIQFSINPV